MNPSSSLDDMEEKIKKSLFQNAMKGDWREVIKTCKEHPSACTAKITSSGDTALHIAISNGDESVVKDLVAAVGSTPGALEAKNELGNTPLHLAAYLGEVRMCLTLCKAHRGGTKLMGIRNDDNETPFFLAIRHGRKEAFQALHSMCKEGEGYDYCRGKEGETILHSAISGEYFDLAFYIMGHYEGLQNAVNEHGLSPLHLLANKASAFKSGNHIRGLHKLIYYCIFVDELQLETMRTKAAELDDKEDANYPENYATCVMASSLLSRVTRVLLGINSKEKQDEENKNDKQEEETPRPHQQNGEHPRGHDNILMIVLCGRREANAERHQFEEDKKVGGSSKCSAQGPELFPKNYKTLFNFVKLISKAMLVLLGLGSKSVDKIREEKAKHIWSRQIMEMLLENALSYEYEHTGKSPRIGITVAQDTPPDDPSSIEEDSRTESNKKAAEGDMEKRETPILIAAKSGVVEIVEGILKRFPVAIHDMNNDKKNIVLLAVEHRQPHVYEFLLRLKMKETIFRKTDKDGNSALHLAATLGNYRPWLIPGAALQMQWEIKWYEYVKDSMPLHFFPRYNNKSKTPMDIFRDTHQDLVKEGGQWLTNTSESCSVVAALIATVAFATSATVPGGVKSDNSGTPTLQNELPFSIFAISSLVALCFSVTSVVLFLAILTSRFQGKDFGTTLPRMLLIGLTSLFISIGAMLLSFCAGHFFVLKDKLQYTAFPMYAVTCLPVTFFAIAQFPLYYDLFRATFRKVPLRNSD